MGVLNIICAIVLILASVAVIALVSMQGEQTRHVRADRRPVRSNWPQLRQNQRRHAVQRHWVLTAALFVQTIIISIIDKFSV